MSSQQKTSLGCLYSAWLGVVCTVLLVVNFEIVRAILDMSGLRAINSKAAQVIQFFLPIILIIIEFWLFDLFSDRAELQEEVERPLERKN